VNAGEGGSLFVEVEGCKRPINKSALSRKNCKLVSKKLWQN
jgi:hypothetical protein